MFLPFYSSKLFFIRKNAESSNDGRVDGRLEGEDGVRNRGVEKSRQECHKRKFSFQSTQVVFTICILSCLLCKFLLLIKFLTHLILIMFLTLFTMILTLAYVSDAFD